MFKLVRLRSGEEVDKCSECGRTWEVVVHSSKGMCRGCARMKQHAEAKPPQRWSKDFDCCRNPNCPNTIDGVSSQPHNADGFCRSCYSNKQRYVDLQHSHEVEAVRRAQPGYAEKQKERYDAWYANNKEQHIQNTTQYAKDHPEQQREWNATYREANREMCRASYKKWYGENQEKSAGYYRKWRQEHPEEARQLCRNRRARLANAEGTFTADEWADVCEDHNFQCYHCHKGIDDGILLTPDHLICISKGGSNFIANIAPLCGSCNSSKVDKDLWEFDPEYFEERFRK